MLHDQTINFLETTIIFLLLTNAASAIAAAYAISLAQKGRPVLAMRRVMSAPSPTRER